MATTDRCPNCGALVTPDAEWCGQCYEPLRPEEPPKVDPERAAIWSLVLPGLGHWKLGRKGDAIARFVLFGWSFGTLCVLIGSRIGKGGLGPTAALFALFASASLAIYALSVLDAYRLAKGEEPVVSTR